MSFISCMLSRLRSKWKLWIAKCLPLQFWLDRQYLRYPYVISERFWINSHFFTQRYAPRHVFMVVAQHQMCALVNPNGQDPSAIPVCSCFLIVISNCFEDTNSCLVLNGGCDFHTQCISAPNGSVTCGPCPTGFIGTGSSGCVGNIICLLKCLYWWMI